MGKVAGLVPPMSPSSEAAASSDPQADRESNGTLNVQAVRLASRPLPARPPPRQQSVFSCRSLAPRLPPASAIFPLGA